MECVWGVRLIRHGYGLAMWDEEKRRRVMAAPCGPRTMGLFFLWCLMACPPELGGNLLTLKVRILKHWRIFILFYILLREILPPPPQVVLVVKITPTTAGDERDMGLNPGSGRSPGVGSGNPLQYSCLEIFIDRGAWQAAVCGATKNRTWLSTREILNIYNSRENK